MNEPSERRRRIVDLVASGLGDADQLGATLGVSVSTIRRDLSRLSHDGHLLRTYGGAAPASPVAPERPIAQRALERVAEKRAIALKAAQFVADGETIILDAGTTTGVLAALLATRSALRVITNGLTAIEALAAAEGVELILLGGRLRQISLGFVGPHAEATMRRMTAARVFLGADGVVAGRGICEATDEQAALKSLMIAQANEIFVLATADKLGRAASEAWTPIERDWTLITDDAATDEALAPFLARGVTVLRCETTTRAPQRAQSAAVQGEP